MTKHRMRCALCGHDWDDLPGAWGEHYKSGCPACRSLYWRAEGLPLLTAPDLAEVKS